MTELATNSPAYGVFARDMLPERIATRLVSLIAERQLHPGDKLPPERELAVAMGVSRPSLREALRALAMLNVVEIRQGSGTFVTSLRPEVMVEHFDFVFALDDATFAELLEARQMIEPALASAAASHASSDELERLRACVARAASHSDDPNAFLEADLELHEIIAAAAHNQIIARFMSSLTRLGMASRRRTVALPGVRTQSVKDHAAMVDALARRDPEAAAEIMRKHLANIRDSLRETAVHDNPLTDVQGEPHGADYHVG